MLSIQEFFKNNSLDELSKQFGIKVKIYEKFIGLNYDQIESPKTHQITMECRSLKLIKGTWEVASRAFDRFFNYGECPDQYEGFDFSKAIITEKVDGSIVPIWYNIIDNRWEISSKSAIFGESFINNTEKTFRQGVLDILKMDEYKFQQFFNEHANKLYTYIFEYIGPDNFIVTPYKENQLVMIGIRDIFSNNKKYRPLEEMKNFVEKLSGNVRLFKIYNLNSFDDIMQSMKDFKNMEEGYVVWDMKNDLRVKVKSPQYVALHHIRGKNLNTTKEGLINVVINGEIDEVIVYFPHLKDKLQNIKTLFDDIIVHISSTYESLKIIESQKEYAKEALKYKFSALLFSARKNNTSIEHELFNSSNDYKLKLLLSANEIIKI